MAVATVIPERLAELDAITLDSGSHSSFAAGHCGYVQVGNTRYPNSWVEPGKTIRQVSCAICDDTGDVLNNNGTFLCGCTLGWLA